jgi:hypothetical protein
MAFVVLVDEPLAVLLARDVRGDGVRPELLRGRLDLLRSA